MKRRVHLKLPSTYTQKLSELIGEDEAAKEIGTTPWSIRRHITNKIAPKSVEIAAKSIYEDLYGSKKETTAIVSGDKDTLQLVQKIVKMSDGNYTLVQ